MQLVLVPRYYFWFVLQQWLGEQDVQLKAWGEVTARVLLQELKEEKPCVSSSGGKEDKTELLKNL